MGLDQYLLRKAPMEDAEHVGYWRKQNAIHAWFVDNLNEGREINCEAVEVNLEQLAGLRQTCLQVIDEPALADELLPSRSGFFFGDTDYDEWYFNGLRETVEIIDRVLAAARAGDMRTIYYDAWW